MAGFRLVLHHIELKCSEAERGFLWQFACTQS